MLIELSGSVVVTEVGLILESPDWSLLIEGGKIISVHIKCCLPLLSGPRQDIRAVKKFEQSLSGRTWQDACRGWCALRLKHFECAAHVADSCGQHTTEYAQTVA